MTVERYFSARSAGEAVSLVAAHDDASVIAGGTDRVVATRRGTATLEGTLIALDRITELRGWEVEADGSLRIGALTSHAEVEGGSGIRGGWPALADASALVGSPATRNFGTVGGNVMNASPAMELGSPLLVYEAQIEVRSERGSRTVGLADLVTGPGLTAAERDELLTSVRLAAPPPGSGSAYVRLQYRRAMEIAVVGAAALLVLDGDVVREARIALTAVAPTCVRASAAEEALGGESLSEPALQAAARVATDAAAPITDVRADAGYRQSLVSVIAFRALLLAARRARGEQVPIPATTVSPATTL
jgi:CO/xanthine dehydrogenase FAD-binding subunit